MPIEPRPPAVAGQFYPADAAELATEIERCFLDPRGPGELPLRRRRPERRIRAAIVPHAGYQYSGPIAARAFREIAEDRAASAILLLGVDHHGDGAPFALSNRRWATPLGPVGIDAPLVERLDRPPIRVDETAHANEHSIEVELPFLQYVEPAPRIVPLMVRYDRFERLEEVARAVRAAIDGKDVLLFASTDFSHYVPADEARRLDRLALDRIRERDAQGLYRTVERERISMCGIAPTTVLLLALQGEALGVRELAWGHSGEAEPMARVVGYASLLFELSGTGQAPFGRSRPST